jgi:hypothetical protein
LAAALLLASPAAAQIPLYAQRLPDSTVYVRFANALPQPASVGTGFAGSVALGAHGADRISPYYVAGEAGGTKVALEVTAGDHTVKASFAAQPGSFMTVVLHPSDGGVRAAAILDHPEYNQLRARLTFYNATPSCVAGALLEGAQPIFTAIAPDAAAARSVNPVASATVSATCATGRAPPLDLGRLTEGGLYSVWLMQLVGGLVAFMARDTIAPPQG